MSQSAANANSDSAAAAASSRLKKAKSNVKSKNKKFHSLISSLTHSKSSNDVNKTATDVGGGGSVNNNQLFMNNNKSQVDHQQVISMTNERNQRSVNPTSKLIKSISNMNIKQQQQQIVDNNQIRLQYENMPSPANHHSSE